MVCQWAIQVIGRREVRGNNAWMHPEDARRHDRAGVQLRVARAHAGACINDPTDDRLTDRISANAAFSAVPVWIEAA